jgi:ATP-binding cassette subfamily F protein 3
VKPFDGDIEDYRIWLLNSRRTGASREEKASKAEARRGSSGRRKQIKPLKDKAEAAEKEIARVSAEIASLDAALAESELFAREPVKAAALSKQRTEAAAKLERAEAAWLAASEDYESALADAS